MTRRKESQLLDPFTQVTSLEDARILKLDSYIVLLGLSQLLDEREKLRLNAGYSSDPEVKWIDWNMSIVDR